MATTGPILFLTSFDSSRHTDDVCFAALNIIANFSSMQLPPPLQHYTPLIKVGVGSGSVAGAIVSLKFPLYTLLGDTVNLASRLASASSPFRILTSKAVHERERARGYRFLYNGQLALKGKGELDTYWLIAHDYFPYKVDPSDADRFARANDLTKRAPHNKEVVSGGQTSESTTSLAASGARDKSASDESMLDSFNVMIGATRRPLMAVGGSRTEDAPRHHHHRSMGATAKSSLTRSTRRLRRSSGSKYRAAGRKL